MALVRHPDRSVGITAAPLRVLIRLAYGVQDQAIVDAPAWMASTRFSIDATPPANAGADAIRQWRCCVRYSRIDSPCGSSRGYGRSASSCCASVRAR